MNKLDLPFPSREASVKVLEQDACFDKIASEQVSSIIDKAWQKGLWAAERFLGESIDQRMRYYLPKLGLTIYELDQDYVLGNTRYYSDYISNENVINLYRKSIDLWARKNRFTYEDSVDLILAHEYFHYLEWHEIGLTSKQYLVPMILFGPVRFGKTGIAALSEIAANAFANHFYTTADSHGGFKRLESLEDVDPENDIEDNRQEPEKEFSIKRIWKRIISI